MTDTPNLGLPFIEGSQAQKHVTHNEALRILDAAIQVAVLDLSRTSPPSSPAEGERHVVATGATGAWAGHGNAIATWQDGAWAFLVPKSGWCVWSVADNVVFVFDGTHWRDLRDLPVTLDNAVHIGINTSASSPNLLSVKSNAALLTAIPVADGGSGDARLQISKESAAKTASVFFSDAFSGRAEFGLVGSDAFKLKVSADGSSWLEAFTIDQATGNLALPRGVALTGVIAPPQITANQNDYNPAGVGAASVLQLSSDASRNVTGLQGGTDGRLILVCNAGSNPIVLKDSSASSSAANRFNFGADVTLGAKQGCALCYSATASRWSMFGQSGAALAANNLSDLANVSTARANLAVPGAVRVQKFTSSGTYTPSAGMLYCIIECVGAGGGGGGVAGNASNAAGAAGGGAGGYSRKIASAATVGASQSVTIGAAGTGAAAGNNNGGAGGQTSVGSLCVANGGAGGNGTNTFPAATPGAGGTAGTGDVASPGSAGGGAWAGAASVVNSVVSGGGGSGPFGEGGLPVFANAGVAAGAVASGYGAGGSGAAAHASTSNAAGGAGVAGFVFITEFCSQ
jgi:hypothetical protein